MTQRLIYAALAVLALSAPAAAQGYEPRGYEPRGYEPRGYEPGAMPPYEVFTMLRSAGLDPVGAPARRGPNYVLRAFDRSDREVRVVVDARSGDILSVRPIAMASREQPLPPRGGMGAYERMPPGYVPPDTYRGGSNARPSIDDDDDDAPPPRQGTIERPPQGMTPGPGALPRSSNAVPSRNNGGMRPQDDDDDDIVRSAPPRDPSVIRADPDRSGMLPPPPERFPQRAAPAAPSKPKPVQPAQRSEPVQRSAAAPPKQAPLPRPKPSVSTDAPPPAIQPPPAKWEDPPAPAAAPAKSPSADDTPH